jgi:hypothetical protein
VGSSVGIATDYGLDGPGIEVEVTGHDYTSVQGTMDLAKGQCDIGQSTKTIYEVNGERWWKGIVDMSREGSCLN